MDSMVKDKNNSDKSSNGREPNEMLELLKTFYNPGEENKVQDFPEFFAQIEERLEKESPANKIANSTTDLENIYLERQQRLEQLIRRIDETKVNPLARIKRKSKRKTLLLIALLLTVFFAGIYFFKNYQIVERNPSPSARDDIGKKAQVDTDIIQDGSTAITEQTISEEQGLVENEN